MNKLYRHPALLGLLLGTVASAPAAGAQSINADVPINVRSAGRGPVVGIGVVSARSLTHQAPKTARKEFDRGLRASDSGRSTEALRHFAAAVESDPEYLDAQAYLGRLYLLQGDASLGLEHIERALLIEPFSDVLHSNRAAALMMLQRPMEAEQAARRALQLAPASLAAHYMLGLALLRQNRATKETAEHLEIAAGKYPDVLPGLGWVRGRLAAAPRK